MTSVAHTDLDAHKYSCASVGEERTILVIHKQSGREKTFKTRTEFWGHHKKKAGGWLAEVNKQRLEKGQEPFLPDDFEIQDKQEVKEPLANILHTCKLSVESAVKASGADKSVYYIGKGESFRVGKSTLLEYKGNRTAMMKPLLLDEVSEYLTRKFGAEVITGLEVDDVVNMNAYRKKGHFQLIIDKDGYGAGADMFNFQKPEEGIVKTDCFGKLFIDASGKSPKVRGYGRMFKLWQCCSLDDSDNYRANCMSDIKWGEMSAYKALVDCKNDKELFEAAVGVFKNLYPQEKIVKGWRGSDISINWLYVMQECLDMCHMLRFEGDRLVVTDILDKLGVNYA
jgi:hypothetical protein